VCCACVRCDESTSMVRKDVETFNVFFRRFGNQMKGFIAAGGVC